MWRLCLVVSCSDVEVEAPSLPAQCLGRAFTSLMHRELNIAHTFGAKIAVIHGADLIGFPCQYAGSLLWQHLQAMTINLEN